MPISGTASAYPATLPVPQEADIQPAERRVLSPPGGLFEARTGQTDRLEFQTISFPPMDEDVAALWQAWWEVDLVEGGIWFDAVWPLPRGWVSAIRKFVEPPSWEFIPSGRWRVTATFELRGVGELPIDPDPPSAWNPLDMLTADAPVPIELTNSFRTATRETNSDSFEGGVRGVRSHSGSGKWYLELKILSTGNGAVPISDNQNLTFGLVDDSKKNILEFPLNDDSDYTTSDALNWLLGFTRFDGAVGARVFPAAGGLIGDVGGQPQPGDVFGFAWEVGTAIDLYLNGALMMTVPFTYTGAMFPYMSAGQTLVNGPDPDGNGESVLICTGKRQFAYFPPDGFFAWG